MFEGAKVLDEFERSLLDFIDGDLSFQGLCDQLKATISTTPDLALDVSVMLDRHHGEGELSANLHQELGSLCIELSEAAKGDDEQFSDEQLPDEEVSLEVIAEPESGSLAAKVEDSGLEDSELEGSGLEGEVLADSTGNIKHHKKTLKGRFVLEEHIATGGMGSIFKALDLRKEELQDKAPFIAIKILSEDFKAHPDALIALQRESAHVQKLAHPNIVTVYDFDRDGDTVFMTMELLDGRSISDLVKQSGVLPRDQSMAIIAGMARGLVYAHSKGIIHADLKPSNIFLTTDGAVKLLDFGIARAIKSAGDDDATLFNPQSLGALTPSYASMEMFNDGENPDPRDDIYGLACVAYELLSGKHPFNRLPSTAASAAKLKPARIAGLSRKQWAILVKSLAFERSARTPSVLEFLDQFVGDRSGFSSGKNKTTFPAKSFIVLVLALLVSAYFILNDYFASAWLDKDELGVAAIKSEVMPPLETVGDKEINANLKSNVHDSFQEHEAVVVLPDDLVDIADEKENTLGLESLLIQAEQQFSSLKITRPSGDNAYETYRQVLKLDPENTSALEGVSGIAEYYKTVAVRRIKSGRLKEGLEQIERGLIVFPQDVELLYLQDQVRRNISAQGGDDELIELLRLANRQLADMKLTSPDDDNAFQTFQLALVKKPSSIEAVEGLNKIANQYFAFALAKQKQGDIGDSLYIIEKGLFVVADHKELLRLKSELVKRHVNLAEKNIQINKLFQKADRQYNVFKKIVSPKNDSAYHTYKDILRVDPGNKLALNRMEKIIQRLLSLASRRLSAGKLVKPVGGSAIEIYKSILSVEPENAEALAGFRRVELESERQVRSRLNDGSFEEGLSIVNDSLAFFPSNRQLLALRVEFEERIASKERNR